MLLPLGLLVIEGLLRRAAPRPDWRFAPIMLAGFLLYWLTGLYRESQEAGGRGMKSVPVRLLDTGPYAITRNPMYLGHLLFTAGVALALRSPLGLVALLERWSRFDARVRADEERLVALFGDDYRAYQERVPRWLPEPPRLRA